MANDLTLLQQAWPMPSKPRPIVIIGAGGIVNDAHLPAYRKAGFTVAGVFDVDRGRSEETAKRWQIPRVFGSIGEARATPDVVFDVAVPPEHLYEVVKQLPLGAAVLMQKPMGKDLIDARRVRDVCRNHALTAAVNFQLRFSSMMLAIRDAIARGMLGRVLDVEVNLNVDTPWGLFPFLKKLDRVEIQVHSIHYLDLVRSFLGEPRGVYAKTVAHPELPDLKSTRTSAILDYGPDVRCVLSINHHHVFGPARQAATIKLEGNQGAAVAKLGVLMNYPTGEADALSLARRGENKWHEVPLRGRWFPDAFIGTMANLQRAAAGEDEHPWTGVEDAYRTMALVEACYQSSASGGTPIPE
jgi:predicted dehydrogenase